MKPKEYAKILDLREVCKDKRVIIIGDPHGCDAEVHQLLKLVDWKMTNDILIFTGDLIDRGPGIARLVNFARFIENIYCCEGNHENKLKRFLKGNNVKVGSLLSTLTQFKWELEQPRHKQELFEWLDQLPQIIRFRDTKYVAHAGIDSRFPVYKQDPFACRLIRTYSPDKKGSYNSDDCPPWYNSWHGPETIYFGHNVHNVGEQYYFPYARALDAGCVYGGHLRAVVIEADDSAESYHTVKAAKQYYDPEGWRTEDV
jgi:protein phosphatase